MILKKYHSFFVSKIRKDVAKFVVCCSHDWSFNLRVNLLKPIRVSCSYQLDQSILVSRVVEVFFSFLLQS